MRARKRDHWPYKQHEYAPGEPSGGCTFALCGPFLWPTGQFFKLSSLSVGAEAASAASAASTAADNNMTSLGDVSRNVGAHFSHAGHETSDLRRRHTRTPSWQPAGQLVDVPVLAGPSPRPFARPSQVAVAAAAKVTPMDCLLSQPLSLWWGRRAARLSSLTALVCLQTFQNYLPLASSVGPSSGRAT